MLPCRVDVHADLLFDSKNFSQRQLGLSHVLDSLHEQTSMGTLLCHQAYNVHFVDLVADFEFIKLRVQGFEVLAHRVQQTDKQGLLALDQINVHLCFSLNQLLMQVIRCLHGTRNVYKLRELKLKVLLQFCHL